MRGHAGRGRETVRAGWAEALRCVGLYGGGAEARMIWQPRAELKCAGMRVEGGRGAQARPAEVCWHAGGESGPALACGEWRGGHTRCAGVQVREGRRGAEGKGRAEVRAWSGGGWGGLERRTPGHLTAAQRRQDFLTAAQRWPCMNKANKMLQHCAFTDWLEVNCMRKWSDSK